MKKQAHTSQRSISLFRPYLDLLKMALSNVDSMYYAIPTTYKPGLTRERVFCYELYHQIRLLTDDQHRLTLHGEVDKSGHRDFVRADQRNPDFIFHRPGTHKDNMLVIEVKGNVGGRYRRGIKKDFDTLLSFVEKYHYRAGAFVLFGYSFVDLMNDMGSTLKNLQTHPNASSVYILCIKSHRTPCEELQLTEI